MATKTTASHSLTGSDVIRPEPANAEDVSKRARARRARLPRSQSTGNMLEAVEASTANMKYEPRDTVEEPNVRTNLRDLAKFFRTTAPPVNQPNDNCMPLARPDRDNGKRSFQSLMRRKRAAKVGTQSLQLQPLDRVIAKKTIEGYPYATIELSNQPDAEGPWFRSQYPVFPDTRSLRQANGPPQWPERTTSRGVLSSASSNHTTPKAPKRSERQLPKQESDAAEVVGGATNDDLKNFTEARLQATNFLRGLAEDLQSTQTPNTVDRLEIGQNDQGKLDEQELVSSFLPSAKCLTDGVNSHGVAVEFPATPPPSGRLQQFEWSEVVISSGVPSPSTSPRPLLERRRNTSLSKLQAGSSSPESFITPTSLSVATQESLAVPQKNLSPESPGFPNMLAAMTFPSPPRSSRSASLASTLNSPLPKPSVGPPVPIVRPRTSSKNAITTPAGTVSLDEVVMQPSRPGLLHSKSDYALGSVRGVEMAAKLNAVNTALAAMDTTVLHKDSTSARPSESAKLPEQSFSLRSDSVASFVTACEEHLSSRATSALSNTNPGRQSTSSVLTSTTSSHRQSTSTNRQSTRSNATTVSTAHSIGENPRTKDASTVAPQSAVDLWLPDALENSSPLGPWHAKVKSEDTSGSSAAAITTGDRASKMKGTPEGRMTRKWRSDGFRAQSVDLVRSGPEPASSFDSVDSPVLGRFPQNRVPARKASIHGPSPLVQMAPSTPIIESVEDDVYHQVPTLVTRSGARIDGSASDASFKERSSSVPSAVSTASVRGAASEAWCMSPVMTADIEPLPLPDPPAGSKNHNITMSPMIVVANVEPKAIAAAPFGLRLSRSIDMDADDAPCLPTKSPHRPRVSAKRLSRQIPLPIKIASSAPPTGNCNSARSDELIVERGSHPAFPTPFKSRSLKRLSLPIYMTSPNTPLTFLDRASTSRRQETQTPAQPQSELQAEQESEPEIEPFPRRRSAIVKERFHLARMAREKEIAELVAKTAPSLPSMQEDEEPAEEQQQTKDEQESSDKEDNTTDEIERRIQLLEKHSDAWLSVLDPLLNNMTRTLKEMKTDGQVSPLMMREFVIDMAAEARRSILTSSAGERAMSTKGPITFEGFDGAHQTSEVRPDPETIVRIKQSGRGRSPSRIARLRLPLDQPPVEKVIDPPQPAEPNEPEGRVTTPTVLEKTSVEMPRTPQQHEFEAEMVVRKRIEAQEVMMDELMNKWGMSRTSQDSRRSSIAQPPTPLETSSGLIAHSRSSSASTVKALAKENKEQIPTSVSSVALRNAPLDKHWLKDEEIGNARRGSRRWSSAGERVSWKPGDNRFMNILMQELSATSRLSLESKADIESLL